MNSSLRQEPRQSRLLAWMLVLVTILVAVAFILAWMLQWSSGENQPIRSARAEPVANPPEKRLKLLSAEVVSRVNLNAENSGGVPDQRLQIAPAAPIVPIIQRRKTKTDIRVNVPPDVNYEIDQRQSPSREPMQIAYLQNSDTPVDVFVESVNNAPSEQAIDPDSSRQLDAIRQLIDEASAIYANDFEERNLISVRSEKLDLLESKSAQIEFLAGSKRILSQANIALTEIFDILSLYDDVQITVAVKIADSGSVKQNLLLSQERGRAIIARGVSHGIQFSRFTLEVFNEKDDPENIHAVKIKASTLPNTLNQ